MDQGEITLIYDFLLLILLTIIIAIEFKSIIIPLIYRFVVENIPLSLITPSTKQSIILKKYAYGRIVEEEDQYLVDHLSSIGLMHTGIHEQDLPDDMITLVPTARTTDRGITFLRYHLI